MVAGQEIEVLISSAPNFVILPSVHNLTATVFDSWGRSAGLLSSGDFGVFFSSVGRIVLLAAGRTNVSYFSVTAPFECTEYFLSTSPMEMWGSDQNFTIGHSQNICLVHISDSTTNVAVTYETEPNFDQLFYEYSGGTAVGSYSGDGRSAAVSNMFTVFRWHTDKATLSKSIEIELSSPESSLAARRSHAQGSGPVILVDTPPKSPAPTDGGGAMPVAIVAGAVVGGLVLIVACSAMLCVCVMRRRREKRRVLPRPLVAGDGSDAAEEIDLADIEGSFRDRS